MATRAYLQAAGGVVEERLGAVWQLKHWKEALVDTAAAVVAKHCKRQLVVVRRNGDVLRKADESAGCLRRKGHLDGDTATGGRGVQCCDAASRLYATMVYLLGSIGLRGLRQVAQPFRAQSTHSRGIGSSGRSMNVCWG